MFFLLRLLRFKINNSTNQKHSSCYFSAIKLGGTAIAVQDNFDMLEITQNDLAKYKTYKFKISACISIYFMVIHVLLHYSVEIQEVQIKYKHISIFVFADSISRVIAYMEHNNLFMF